MMRRFFGVQEFIVLLLLGLASLFFSCERLPFPESYFPETGRNALYQRSLDLQNNLNVLLIAIQPGYEDLSALAYFRIGRGAKVMSAYVTNGEAGDSDVCGEYPPYLAATRREEASNALSYLGGEAYFLNMPDIAAARDSTKVRESWHEDSLQARLADLFLKFKPDVLIVARDWSDKENSPRWEVLYSDVLTAVKKIAPVEPQKTMLGTDTGRFWDIDRVFVDDGKKESISIPVDERHPRWKKTYREIGEEAGQMYASLAIQRPRWMHGEGSSYRLVYSTTPISINEIDEGLPRLTKGRLRSIDKKIQKLTAKTLDGKTKGVLKELVAVKDSVNFYIVHRYRLPARERRTVFEWNRGLENLRCALLGVEVKYSISETELTERQLTFLTIDEIKGIKGEGETDIYFADMEPGWAINEDVKKRVVLKLHEKYRLLTPGNLDYTFPPGQFKQQSSTFGKSFSFFIIHRAPSREQSFAHRTKIELSYGPRFVTEVLTPVVRMVPGAWVVVRLRNLSRDGVADTIEVNNELGFSSRSAFRMSYKGSSHLDTLFIRWKGEPDDGDYLIPVQIDEFKIANFVARKFNVEVDSSKKIGIITGLRNSSTENGLRRLNVKFSNVRLDRTFFRQVDTLDVLIVDRRLLTLKPKVADFKDEIDNFVNRGGHLIVLAQEAESWNDKPLWEGIRLKPTLLFDEKVPIQADTSHTLLKSPNPIRVEDWEGWLFLRGYNIITGSGLEGAHIPVRVKKENAPLIVTRDEGKGKRTYIDLALHHQWMNIHPGAFRLLANLISY